MSYQSLRLVADANTLAPMEKLVLFQIASFHNIKTGQCNPSPARIARATGLPITQVRKIAQNLVDAGWIGHDATGFIFYLSQEASEIPEDFWPTDETLQALAEDHPQHHFSTEEAVNDFISFARRTGYRSDNPNLAFYNNISTILRHRRPGPVQIGSESERDGHNSVGNFLAGRD